MTYAYVYLDLTTYLIIYAGITSNLKLRDQQHRYLKKKNQQIDILIQSNPENYEMIKMHSFVTLKEAENWEKLFIKNYNLQKVGMNRHQGGSWKENRVPIYCITNGKTYKSITEAAEDTGCDERRISEKVEGSNLKWKKSGKPTVRSLTGKKYCFSLKKMGFTL
jgi:predicted GIY-YIG superfamily endonuclease